MSFRRTGVCRRVRKRTLRLELLEDRRVLSRAAGPSFDPPASGGDRPSHEGSPWAGRDVSGDDSPRGASVAAQHAASARSDDGDQALPPGHTDDPSANAWGHARRQTDGDDHPGDSHPPWASGPKDKGDSPASQESGAGKGKGDDSLHGQGGSNGKGDDGQQGGNAGDDSSSKNSHGVTPNGPPVDHTGKGGPTSSPGNDNNTSADDGQAADEGGSADHGRPTDPGRPGTTKDDTPGVAAPGDRGRRDNADQPLGATKHRTEDGTPLAPWVTTPEGNRGRSADESLWAAWANGNSAVRVPLPAPQEFEETAAGVLFEKTLAAGVRAPALAGEPSLDDAAAAPQADGLLTDALAPDVLGLGDDLTLFLDRVENLFEGLAGRRELTGLLPWVALGGGLAVAYEVTRRRRNRRVAAGGLTLATDGDSDTWLPGTAGPLPREAT
jgi:hypothetical protein